MSERPQILGSLALLGVVGTFSIALEAAAGPPTVEVAHWSFDRGEGASVLDASGSGPGATLAHGATRGPGAVARGLVLDGVDDRLRLPPGLLGGWRSLTVSAWVRPVMGGDGRRRTLLAITPPKAGDSPLLWLGLNARSGTWVCMLRTDGDTEHRQGFLASAVYDHWVHVTFVIDVARGAIHLYTDGRRRGSFTGLPWQGARLDSHARAMAAVGAIPNGKGGAWKGSVDEVRIRRGASSAAEIAALYTASPPPPTPTRPDVDVTELVGHWRFDGGSVASAVQDDAGGNHPGALVGGARLTPGKAGTALSLDGRHAAMTLAGEGLVSGWNALSVAAWVRPQKKGRGDWPTLLEQASGGEPRHPHVLWVGFKRSSGRWAFQLATDRSENHFQSLGQRVPYGRWSHVVMVLSVTGRWARLYVDGDLKKEITDLPLIGDSLFSHPRGETAVGMIATGRNNHWHGEIDDLRIYRGVVSATEARALADGE